MNRAEALEIFEENLPEIADTLRVAHATERYELQQEYSKKQLKDDINLFWVQREMFRILKEKIDRKYMPIRRAIDMKLNPPAEGELDIEKAKQYPIENLLDEEPRRGMIRCPLHNEKTPSCQIKNNRFTCYGCGEYGDVIDLHMKLNGTSFVETVRALLA